MHLPWYNDVIASIWTPSIKMTNGLGFDYGKSYPVIIIIRPWKLTKQIYLVTQINCAMIPFYPVGLTTFRSGGGNIYINMHNHNYSMHQSFDWSLRRAAIHPTEPTSGMFSQDISLYITTGVHAEAHSS